MLLLLLLLLLRHLTLDRHSRGIPRSRRWNASSPGPRSRFQLIELSMVTHQRLFKMLIDSLFVALAFHTLLIHSLAFTFPFALLLLLLGLQFSTLPFTLPTRNTTSNYQQLIITRFSLSLNRALISGIARYDMHLPARYFIVIRTNNNH